MFVQLIAAVLGLCAMVAPAIAQSPDLATLARGSGTPEIPGLKIIWLFAVGRRRKGKSLAQHHRASDRGTGGFGPSRRDAQAKNPTRRGVTVWVETDGTVYWAVPEDAIPTHGDGANRRDNKYIDNGPTFRQVLKDNSIGVEFSGNFPDVARPATAEQIAAWRILVRVLQARYNIPSERVYAHNWIDYKDARYCEGCDLATLARGAKFSTKPAR